MVSSELVKLALCFIILMVSLSKCEIDSSTGKVQPSGFPPTPPRAPTTTSSSGDVALKTTHSSSSSSSTSSSAGGATPTTTTSNNDGRSAIIAQEEQRILAQSKSRHNNASTNIISSAITPTPTVASPIWTSLYSPKQEVGGGGGAGARETSQQQHYQIQDNNNNKREDFSTSYSPAFITNNREKKLAGVAAVPVLGDLLSTSLPPRVEKPSTTSSFSSSSSRNSFQRGFTPSIPSQQILGTVFPGDNGNDEELIPNEDYSDRSSQIPRHTWLPGGLTFSCKNRVPGYYADASSIAKCQVYHMCMTDGRKYSMLCGIGTVFNQLTFVCDHWYNYKCSDAETDYKINSQLWEDLVGEGEDSVDPDEENNRDQIGDQVVGGDSSGRPRGAIHPPPPQISSSRLSTSRQALS